jgi:2-oxoglutarate dehydrogenase E2 component (dihydrolipoamide succinyltransferase)
MTEIIVPSPGESITQVQIARWLVSDGETVDKDQEVVEIDSDKATFPVSSPVSGKLRVLVPEGETVGVGKVIANIEESSQPAGKKTHPDVSGRSVPGAPSPAAGHPPAAPGHTSSPGPAHISASPLARKLIGENRLDLGNLGREFPGKKITRKTVEKFLARKFPGQEAPGNRAEERKKLSTLRLKIAERLVSVKNETAMLTTFNEINMRKLLSVKEKYSEDFKQRHGEGIGLITFFARACTVALSEFPQVNSILDGEELIIPRYVDLGIAVSTPKGLMVPVIRNTESMNMEEIGLRIREMASKARENRITIDDMKGGTFTITNGGVFGSLLSTPILNPPQSAILGLHKIMDRPVAVEGRIEIHPMMYIALSYDHRVIDGKESVGFVIRIKELIEEPEQMLSSGTTRQTV